MLKIKSCEMFLQEEGNVLLAGKSRRLFGLG